MGVRGWRWAGAALLAAGWLLALAACASGATATGGAGTVRVVAAENFWGSIAAQLGGAHVRVTSIIANPATDPHDYEPSVRDARAFAGASYAIVNGAGYDAWAQQSLDANPDSARVELDVGRLAGRKPGDNPHLWYNPAIVGQVAARMTADLKRLDPADAAYFDQQQAAFTTVALKPYTDLIATLKARYTGTPVGATESIFADMAAALGLDLVTPPTLMTAIAEGGDLTAADKATMNQQITQKQIAVLVFNAQNTTSDVNGFVSAARAAGIPVVAITETLSPANVTFEAWQVAQLQALQAALALATGK
jgi:zinc/manganese transport system substrate-binding protein